MSMENVDAGSLEHPLGIGRELSQIIGYYNLVGSTREPDYVIVNDRAFPYLDCYILALNLTVIIRDVDVTPLGDVLFP
jgi:hypothetical protein